jgi:hypothetical protein
MLVRGSNSVVEFLLPKQAVAGSSPVSRFSYENVVLGALHKPLDSKRTVRASRSNGFFCGKRCSTNTCLAFHFLEKVFTNSHRQVGSTWNCLPSNYRTSLQKKQGRQVFSRRQPTKFVGFCRLSAHRKKVRLRENVPYLSRKTRTPSNITFLSGVIVRPSRR